MGGEAIRRWLDTLEAPRTAKTTISGEDRRVIYRAEEHYRPRAQSCPDLRGPAWKTFQSGQGTKRKRVDDCIDSATAIPKRRFQRQEGPPGHPEPRHKRRRQGKENYSCPIPSPLDSKEIDIMDGRPPAVLQTYPSAPSTAASQSSYTELTPRSSSTGQRSRKRKGMEDTVSTATVDNASSSYRSGVLFPNNVVVYGPRDPFAPLVQDKMRQTLDKLRDSPGLDQDQLQDLTVSIQEAAVSSEAELQRISTEAFFFKPQNPRNSMREQLPFHPDSVPQAPIEVRMAVPRIPAPKPDITYGYATTSIPNAGYLHSAKVLNTPTRPYFKPVTEVAQPYLVVEFKDVKDTIWAATNQAVGGGSASVKAAEILKQLANNGVRLSEPATTMAYSAVVYGTYATLHIHWSEYDMQKSLSERERYYAKQVASYDLARPITAREFRQHIRNIVDWGLDERFEYQKGWTKALVDAWIADLAATGASAADGT